jgi:hypothetical protein
MNINQAIKEAGEKAIDEINNGSPWFTNRVMDNDFVEFAASADYIDEFGGNATIEGYWYFTKKAVAEVESIDLLDWSDAEDFEIVG